MRNFLNKLFMFSPDSGGQGGAVVNTSTGTANAYTGSTTTTTALAPTMKTFYDTQLLENSREKMYYQQLGRKYTLPANAGKSIEWRKWNTLPDFDELTEGVIPTGKTLGMTSITVPTKQYGQYATISDRLELHAVDDVIMGAVEELGAAGAKSAEKLCRNVLATNTNVIYADVYNSGSYVSTPSSHAALVTAMGTSGNQARLTPDMVNKAVTQLRKKNVEPHTGGKYVAVIHPSVSYDLRSSDQWINFHQYSATTQIFNGEIGELHGVRFVESTLAPVMAATNGKIYLTMFFGKEAFGVVDPAGAGMETIIKDKAQAGGPLNQFSTVGAKFTTATAILYPERYVIIESDSAYSGTDEANYAYDEDDQGVLLTIGVASAAGTASGDTAITISGYTPAAGDSYLYKVGDSAAVIGFGEIPDYTWTPWNGSSDITAATGKKIAIVSINADGRVVAYGSQTVTAKA